MRRGMFAALALLAAVSFDPVPAQAIVLSAPAALQDAAKEADVTEAVHYYGYGYRPYRSYYRPHYRSYGYRPYYGGGYGYRPYYRSYGYGGGYGYQRPYYRPHYRPYYPYVPPPWVSGPYY